MTKDNIVKTVTDVLDSLEDKTDGFIFVGFNDDGALGSCNLQGLHILGTMGFLLDFIEENFELEDEKQEVKNFFIDMINNYPQRGDGLTPVDAPLSTEKPN